MASPWDGLGCGVWASALDAAVDCASDTGPKAQENARQAKNKEVLQTALRHCVVLFTAIFSLTNSVQSFSYGSRRHPPSGQQ